MEIFNQGDAKYCVSACLEIRFCTCLDIPTSLYTCGIRTILVYAEEADKNNSGTSMFKFQIIL